MIEVNGKRYEVREIETEEVFLLLDIVARLGIEDELKKMFNPDTVPAGTTKEERDRMAREKGIGFAMKLFLSAGAAKKELYELMSSLSAIPVDELKRLKIKQLKQLFIEIKDNAGIMDFLQSSLE